MGAPAMNSLPYAMALLGFVLAALLASPLLRNVLINDNLQQA